MKKLVKESINDESLNETLKVHGHELKIFRYNGEKIYAGEDGLMGQKWIFIPWNIIKKIKELV